MFRERSEPGTADLPGAVWVIPRRSTDHQLEEEWERKGSVSWEVKLHQVCPAESRPGMGASEEFRGPIELQRVT